METREPPLEQLPPPSGDWSRGHRRARRFALLAAGVAAAVILPLLWVAGDQIFSSPTLDEPGDTGLGGISVSGVAMSSPIDENAQFFWELERRPRALIDLDEIISGGPSPDGIPPIDEPDFVTAERAKAWLGPQEAVVAFELDGVARAYPVQILMWHEIVNDVVSGEPVTVSYCPLCNSAIVFSRRIPDRELIVDFGTSGQLYRSDLVMYDRQTKSLWPQIEGRAVVGELIGTELDVLPSQLVSFSQFRAAFPEGVVLSDQTGFNRPYGENPYVGYDEESTEPFLFRGQTDKRHPPKARVLGIEHRGGATAYLYSRLSPQAPTVVHDTPGGDDLVIFYAKGTRSALEDVAVNGGRDVGATGVFRPLVDGKPLTFEVRNGRFTDAQTRSTWNLLGRATAGPLEGRALEGVPHVDTFWFAWAAFQPDTNVWRR